MIVPKDPSPGRSCGAHLSLIRVLQKAFEERIATAGMPDAADIKN